MQTERIDGTDYVIGTPEHAIARGAQRARLDAAYLEAHHHEYERNQRLLAGMDWPTLRLDANSSAFLARELLFVRPNIERMIYDRLRAAEFVPVDTAHPRGADSYSTQLVDHTGEAVISHDLAGSSPRADVSKTEDLRKYVNIRASYAYSVQDLEHAAFAGTPLQRWKMEACADVIARKLDQIGRSGDALSGLTGFFNNALVTVHTLTNGEWLTATVAELIADLFEIEQTIITAARDNQDRGYTLVLPTAYEGRLATTRMDSSSDMTIKEWFLRNARLITAIERYVALDGAVSPAVAAADAPEGICYRRDPAHLFWPIPITYEEQPPQVRGWEWLVEARARCGGVEFRRPAMALYIQNLD